MPEEIKTSGTSWNHASEITKWENAYLQSTRSTPLEDFGSLEEVSEQPIRLAYMGAGPTEEIEPRLLEDGPVGHVFEDGVVDLEESRQITKWRLRYPTNSESLKLLTAPGDGNGEEIGTVAGENVEWFRDKMYVRPGLPSVFMLALGAIWCRGFQIGKRRMDSQTRAKLYREFHELMDHALNHMPSLQATLKAHEAETDIRPDVLERLEGARDELAGGTYHVDLPPFTIEIEDDEDDAPAPRPRNTAASSAELEGGFFPWATGKPVSEGITAIRQGKHGWPETDEAGRPKYPISQKDPHHVEGQFTIIVPDDSQAGAAVEAEMAQRVLDEFDRHTTRLHLACAAYSVKGDPGKYTPIPRQYVYDMLGMKWDQRSDLSRDEKDLKVERAFHNLRKLGVQMRVLDGLDGAPEKLGLESVWNLNTHNWGQKRISDPDRILDTEHWELLVRPNAWHQLYLSEETGARQFGYFSRKLLENIDWGNSPAAGDLAIELLKYVRFQDGGAPRDLTVETMLDICGLGQAQQSYEQTRNRQKLERAIFEQERWGWDVEWTRWPDAYRPDKEDRPDFPRGWWAKGTQREGWEESFKEWKVTFYPPEDLAEMNSRAEKIDNSDPHELEPKGWPDRIRAILNETEYIQADLARILEVSPGAVTRWKKGDRTPGGAHQAKLRDIERRNGLHQS
ncbi:DNA-binding transcriptional regulator YiaG [Salinibacter ruber]|nr:DNA-binding transcriptional regulator YiaG [Salinibacter ruber]